MSTHLNGAHNLAYSTDDSDAILSIDDLHVDYASATGTIHAVRGVNLDIRRGERFGIAGESGSGKTTLINAILRLLPETAQINAGSIYFNDINLARLDNRALNFLRWARIALIPQGSMSSLNPIMKVGRQIAEVIKTHEGKRYTNDTRDRIERILESVGLDGRVLNLYPHELSGGMKQRVCIAMAITLEPELIIADEPTSSLDVVVQRQVAKTLIDVQERLGASIILIGHDMALLAQTAHRIAIMNEGELVELNDVREIYHKPQHQYTRMLINSLPSLEHREERDLPLAFGENGKSAPLLDAQSVTKIFGYKGNFLSKSTEFTALDEVSIEVPGHFPMVTTIAGESGSGKSTFANIVLGLAKPTGGAVYYRGNDIARQSRSEFAQYRREVQAIFQDPYEIFNPVYTVDSLFRVAVKKFKLAHNNDEAMALIEEALRVVNLLPEQIFGKYPDELSGGQRQRLMVARAYLLKPKLIVADEPVSMVDASLRLMILDLMKSLRDELGTSFVYITHDLATAYQISDQIIILNRGKIVERGTPEEVIKNPQHPYSQSLIQAIPSPNPDIKW